MELINGGEKDSHVNAQFGFSFKNDIIALCTAEMSAKMISVFVFCFFFLFLFHSEAQSVWQCLTVLGTRSYGLHSFPPPHGSCN